jgi:DNA helicase-2/ATP-dependent DNA helicase PcrA
LGSAKPSITRASKTTHSGMNIDYDNITHDELRVGTKVMHEKFGKGKIISKEGFADQTKVVVFFNDYGQKKLLLKFARLSILD